MNKINGVNLRCKCIGQGTATNTAKLDLLLYKSHKIERTYTYIKTIELIGAPQLAWTFFLDKIFAPSASYTIKILVFFELPLIALENFE